MKQRVGVVVLLVALAGALTMACVARVPYRLDPTSATQVGRVKARSVLPTDQISIRIVASSDWGGGLIGGAIKRGVENSRRKDAAERVEPLLRATEDLDLRRMFWEKLTPALQAAEWPSVTKVTTLEEATPLTAEDVQDSALLNLYTSYRLSPSSSVFEMDTGYAFFLPGSLSAAAAGSVEYWSAVAGRSADGKTWKEDEEAIALWSADDASAYRQVVDEAIAETVKMLGMALPYVGGKDVSGGGGLVAIKFKLTHGRGDFGISEGRARIRGRILERSDQRLIFQTEQGGALYSLPAAEVEEQPAY
jgi:hypothetical protein